MADIIIFKDVDNHLIPIKKNRVKVSFCDLNDITVKQLPENAIAFQVYRTDEEGNNTNFEVRIGQQVNDMSEALLCCPEKLQNIMEKRITVEKLTFPLSFYPYNDPKIMGFIPKFYQLTSETLLVEDRNELEGILEKNLLNINKKDLFGHRKR